MPGGSPTVLNVRVQELTISPSLTGLCAGYEGGNWRTNELAREMFDHLADFALSYSERQSFTSINAMKQLRRAARVVYNTDNYQRRGEFGELLLHVALTQFFDTEPAVSKLYYKDSRNDTVKGFDAVHVVADDSRLELWLGEVKFYSDLGSAVNDVVPELVRHTESEYLRNEFALVVNKLDPTWPHHDRLAALLDESTSLDDVFDVIRVPVLLTYDSDTVRGHTSTSDPFHDEFASEVQEGWARFAAKAPPDVQIELILVPLHTKQLLVDNLHERLERWQDD